MNDLDIIIRYWRDHLAKKRWRMTIFTIRMIEQTIKHLEELREITKEMP